MLTARLPPHARRRAGRSLSVLAALALAVPAVQARAPDPPRLRYAAGGAELLLRGAPFLILGGELGNSSAGTAAQADALLPRLAARHFNTVLVPVGWNEIEPEEGQFDFSILDHWIAVARRERLHLVLLWFGSWKNGFSSYAPRWVLTDPRRFPTVEFLRDPDAGSGTAGIAGIDQLAWRQGRWTVVERLNGDQTNQGRELLMEAHTMHLYRIRLYTDP